MELVYMISRLGSAFAFYHMVRLLDQERNQSIANLEELENYKITNDCVDKYTRVNVVEVTEDLTKAVKILDALHYIIWACALITVFEFIWLIPCGSETIRRCCRRKTHTEQKDESSDD